MARLPNHAETGWDTILNSYLLTAHNADGTPATWTANQNANFFRLNNLAALSMNSTETLTAPRADFLQISPSLTVNSAIGSLTLFEVTPQLTVNAALNSVAILAQGGSISGDGVSSITTVIGSSANASLASSNPVTNLIGLQSVLDLDGSGVATNVTGVQSQITTTLGSIGTSICFDGSATNLIGTWPTAIGFRCGALQATTTNIGLQIFLTPGAIGAEIGNPVSINDSGTVAAPAASTVLDLQGNSALLLPRMTTAQKNSLTAANGMVVYDTTIPAVSARVNGAWITL